MPEIQHLYQAVLDTAVDAIVIIDEAGIILHCNHSAERMFGHAPGSLAGQNVRVLMPPPHDAQHDDYLRHHLRTGERRIIGVGRDVEGVRADGSTIQLHLAVSAVTVGERTVFAGILRDVTRARAAERRAEELTRSLEEKNRELQSIVYVASHDLRTPLVNIQGFSQELARSCAALRTQVLRPEVPEDIRRSTLAILDIDVAESLSFILRGASKMDALLSGLLRLSRLGRAALDLRELDVARVIRQVGEAMNFQVQTAGAELIVGALPACLADEVQLAQVFSNLLDNALKYRHPDRPPRIEITGALENGRAVYIVRDNGVGIAPHYRDRVFEIFHRLDTSSVPGEGLGLTIAQRIMSRLDGSIGIIDAEGPGAAFRIELPAGGTAA